MWLADALTASTLIIVVGGRCPPTAAAVQCTPISVTRSSGSSTARSSCESGPSATAVAPVGQDGSSGRRPPGRWFVLDELGIAGLWAGIITGERRGDLLDHLGAGPPIRDLPHPPLRWDA
jgi:hypothetical protein